MRLDHLLSTENAGCRSASGANPPARWSRVDGLLVWKMSLALPRRSCGGCRGGADALLGSRIATPGFCLARFDARRACGPAVCRSGRRGGAWWLENWIVDASKTRFFLCLCFAVDFESNSIVRFDRFVIIFSVMICRLGICWRNLAAHACCVCVACKGVWWMPWQTGPMKDV